MKKAKTKVSRKVVNLYNNLMKLTKIETSSLFYFNDYTTGMLTKVRVFDYHMATYEDWELPDALECRGIMFEMDENENPVRIMARPMEKFFNYKENKMADKIDWDSVQYYMFKEDGSLISAYHDCGFVGLKSKASMFSDVAVAAQIKLNDYPDLKARLVEITKDGYTVNMEFVSPNNRIVLPYKTTELRIINIRENESGEYVDVRDIYADPVLRKYLADVYTPDECSDDWIESVRKMTDIEGYVIHTPTQRFKIKTDWYVKKHNFKDAVNNPKALFRCLTTNTIDDVRSMMFGDETAIQKIRDFEASYMKALEYMFNRAVTFRVQNQHLSRKEYAMKANVEFSKEYYLFHMSMFKDDESLLKRINQYIMDNYRQYIPTEYIL